MGRNITTTGAQSGTTRYVSSTYSALANDRIICTAGSFTITLPATANLIDGDTIQIVDIAGNFGASPVTINSNGAAIQGTVQNVSLNVNNTTVTIVYAPSYGWYITR
jgi:hypothetical protein